VRQAFFALLFANLVYFAWAHWVDTPRPAVLNDATALLPQLKLAEELPPSQRPKAHTAPEKTALTEAPACFSIGPFGDVTNSAQAAALLKAKGFDPHQRAEASQTTNGYWVYVGGIRTQAEADKALVTLEHAGIRDALVMPETSEAGRRLSLGLYSERGRAERRAQTVQQTGLQAQVAERKVPGTIYWVDLSPLPGMSTIALQDLFAEGVRSRIAVQPCPAAVTKPAAAAGTATTSPGPAAHESATASNPPAAVAAPAKLP
jgi:SPOR domain